MMAQHVDVDRFRAALAASTGIAFTTDRDALLGDALTRRLRATGRSRLDDYLPMLLPGSNEVAELARLLTVSETFFFRNPEQFRVARGYIERARNDGRNRLRALSAGCSSGEEAYSLAILALDTLGAEIDGWNVEICAVDLNPGALDQARRATYGAWSLRETPQDVRERHFRLVTGGFQPGERVRRMVRFERCNLLAPDPSLPLWRPRSYDLVFCRNVLMYFAADAARGVVARLADALAPGGLMFLGHAETLRGRESALELRQTHATFYYERSASQSPAEARRSPAARADGAVPSAPESTDWLATIARSHARVDARATAAAAEPKASPMTRSGAARIERASVPATPGAADPPRVTSMEPRALPTPAAVAPADLDYALELMRAERFAEALLALRVLPAAVADEPAVQLLRGILLTCGGQPSAAERICAPLLTHAAVGAGAHYVTALCREHADDIAGALRHHEAAIAANADFAMPHLHIGRLHRRRGEHVAAIRELDAAAMLFVDEDPERVALFGGGFTREGLLALCRAERHACGGKP